ncbi:MAG TPA: HupE/UreJ family protein, partial [Pseudomonadales bacterium]|nr:HupE/UreJ family protein [Pseudomonadales bacterium]
MKLIKPILFAFFILVINAFYVSPAYAHRPNESRLTLDFSQPEIQGELLLQISDLEWVVGLDENRDKQISWLEFRTALPLIESQFINSIVLTSTAEAQQKEGATTNVEYSCRMKAHLTDIKAIADRTYAVFGLHAPCEKNASLLLHVGYLQRVDPQHQLLLSIQRNGKHSSALLTPSQPQLELEKTISFYQTVRSFLAEGVYHIFTGYDHVLFILTLVFATLFKVPAVAQRKQIKSLLLIISSFTVAHSITLIATALNWINLPSQWVESAIAVTIIISALNVFRNWMSEKLWLVTFSFGLIHGMGFASAMRELSIPEQNFVVSLLSFNVGVEVGQIVLVGVSVPLLFLLRKRSYLLQQHAIRAGAMAVTLMGIAWL